jgi:hypothetical protein
MVGPPVHFLCKCQQLVDNIVEQLLCTKKNPTISSQSDKMMLCGINCSRGVTIPQCACPASTCWAMPHLLWYGVLLILHHILELW